MKKPTADCRHARLIIEHKSWYSEDEASGGCWMCGGTLDRLERKQVGAPPVWGCNACGERALEEYLRACWLAKSLRRCNACGERALEEYRNRDRSKDRDPGQFMKEIREQIALDRERGVSFYERLAIGYRETVAEILACVPDCPWREHQIHSFRRCAEAFESLLVPKPVVVEERRIRDNGLPPGYDMGRAFGFGDPLGDCALGGTGVTWRAEIGDVLLPRSGYIPWSLVRYFEPEEKQGCYAGTFYLRFPNQEAAFEGLRLAIERRISEIIQAARTDEPVIVQAKEGGG
jgi:hypothetical protein